MKRFCFFLFLCLVLAFAFVLFSCDTSSNGNGDDKHTLTLTDSAASFPSGEYFASLFSGTTYQSDLSVSSPTDLTNGNSVVIANLEEDTAYEIFVWIDTDGGGDNFNDKGSYSSINSIGADVEVPATFSSFDNKKITVTSVGGTITGQTVHCIWLIAGSLDSVVSRDNLYSEANRGQVYHMVGFVNSDTGSVNTAIAYKANYDVGLYTTDFGDLTYDLICVIDADSSGTRTTDDWEGIQNGVTADTSDVSITITKLSL